MAVEILESVKDDEVEEEQKPITGAIEPVPVSLTGETAPDYAYINWINLGASDEPGFFTRAFDAFDEWRDKKQAQIKPFTRDEAREITKENIKRNREMMGNKGYGQFQFGSSRAPSHSSLVRAGLEDPPEEEGEGALLPYLRDDPGAVSRPKLGPERSRIRKEQAKWKTYPKDPAGFLIDPTRPLIATEDGQGFQSEVSRTFEAGGRYYNIPSIVNGEIVSDDVSIESVLNLSIPSWSALTSPVIRSPFLRITTSVLDDFGLSSPSSLRFLPPSAATDAVASRAIARIAKAAWVLKRRRKCPVPSLQPPASRRAREVSCFILDGILTLK